MSEHMRKLPERALVLVLVGSLIFVFGAAVVKTGVQFVQQKIAAVSTPTTAPARAAAPARPVVATHAVVTTARPAPAASTATASPAAASPAVAPPAPPAPPAGVQAGWITEQNLGRDPYGQWLTLSHRALKQATLNLTTTPAPAGAQGARRTVWTAWINTTQAAQTVALHVAGGSAIVTATVDAQSLKVDHSSVWSRAASNQQQVINVQPGWHQVTIDVDRSSGATGQVLSELQLGSADVDPIVPVPWAVPETGTTNQPAPASTAAQPTTSGSENHGR